MSLRSFGDGIEVAIVGASGGLGAAFTRALAEDLSVARVFAFSRRPIAAENARIDWHPIDLEDEASIAAAAAHAKTAQGLSLVVVATGMLHDGEHMQPEKNWDALDAEVLSRAFRANSIGPALAAKHFLPLLARNRRAAFAALSARVGSIGDNRLGGWYAYRASKAALNMLMRTLSIELRRRNPEALCVALHPGTVDTALSRPFQRNVAADKLFSPDFSAARLLAVVDALGAEDSGGFFAWDGRSIPF